MPVSSRLDANTSTASQRGSWRPVETRDLVVVLLSVHLIANSGFLARAFGPRGMAAIFAGFSDERAFALMFNAEGSAVSLVLRPPDGDLCYDFCSNH